MAEDISNMAYWKERLRNAPAGMLHHAIFRCSLGQWQRIEAKHREILARHIKFADSVVDCGCGWGRLLGLMPPGWAGDYLGLDLSPNFIDLAHSTIRQTADRVIMQCDLLTMRDKDGNDVGKALEFSGALPMDWGVMISIRPMVKRNLGEKVWQTMEDNVRKMAKQLLFLEYDETCEGSVE